MDPPSEANTIWRNKTSGNKRKTAFKEVQLKLRRMAAGRARCMYCEDSLGTDIDHFRPKAAHASFAFSWTNYLLACSHCNSNEKRDEFPVATNGEPLLLDPTRDEPLQHFVLVPETGWLEPMTPQGEETERVFGLNRRDDLTQGRADVWTTMTALVRDFGAAQARKDDAAMTRIVGTARRLSFQAAVQYFVAEALSGSKLVAHDIAQTIQSAKAHWAWAL
ncbi:MAG: hypothetical protein KF795_22805 [Labilithrix sp.]|nr:hypothetical protein [Labilithrix sp.]